MKNIDLHHTDKYRTVVVACLLSLLAMVLFLPFLGAVHLFDWDEINFAEISREMLLTGDYFRVHIDFEPFWEKPPLFFWLQSACMRLLGVSEFSARLPNALVGCVVLPLLFVLGKRLYDGAFGLLWACLYAGSFLPHFYFKSGIIDPVFNLWMLLGVWMLTEYYRHSNAGPEIHNEAEPPVRYVALAGGCIGLAVLTKGPVGLLLPVLTWCVVWAVRQTRWWRRGATSATSATSTTSATSATMPFPAMELPVVIVVVLMVSLVWYGVELWRNGVWFLREFVGYQLRLLTTGDSGHHQPFFYHPLVLLLGCFPASAFVFSAFKHSSQDTAHQEHVRLWMLALLAVVVVVFTIVQTKIVHYSSLAYYPITFLGAHTLYHALKRGRGLSRVAQVLCAALGLVWTLVLLAVPLIGMSKERLMPLVRDEFAKANLQAFVVWTGWELGIGILYGLAMLVVVWWMLRKRFFEMAWMLMLSTMLATFAFLVMIAPNIEGYSQRAAIEFYQGLQGKDCYIKALGFKTYADLFYTRKTKQQSPSGANIPADEFELWLLEGAIDKPAYFVCKITDAEHWRKQRFLVELYSKNGFVFFKREPERRPGYASEVTLSQRISAHQLSSQAR